MVMAKERPNTAKAKKYLGAAYGIKLEMYRLEMKIRAERDALTRITPQPGASGGGTPDPHKNDMLCEYVHELTAARRRYVKKLREIEKRIDAVEDDRYRAILKWRYINFASWEQIADQMGRTVRHVTRLHGDALKEFSKTLSK